MDGDFHWTCPACLHIHRLDMDEVMDVQHDEYCMKRCRNCHKQVHVKPFEPSND
jgi:predicted nucleic-acid-binding Zn-ribbon protein